MNGIGQGSFAAALASSLNIGCAVDGITRGICSANIGEIYLNSLIFADFLSENLSNISKIKYKCEKLIKVVEQSS